QATSVKVSPDGAEVFVTGFSTGSDQRYDYATVAYDAVTGQRLWASRYDGPEHYYDYAFALALSPDGTRVFVTGYVSSFGKGDNATIAYESSTGARLRVVHYHGPGDANDIAYSLGVSPDGSKVFVTGSSIGAGTGYDFATVAYDASTGGQLWARRYNGPRNDG